MNMFLHFFVLSLFSVTLWAETPEATSPISETEMYTGSKTCPLKDQKNPAPYREMAKTRDVEKQENNQASRAARMHDKRLFGEIVDQIPEFRKEFKAQVENNNTHHIDPPK